MQGVGRRVQGAGCRVQGSIGAGFGGQGSGCRVQGSRGAFCRAQGSGFVGVEAADFLQMEPFPDNGLRKAAGRLEGILSSVSVSVYLGSQIGWARARFS